jgi:hypothetical protein
MQKTPQIEPLFFSIHQISEKQKIPLKSLNLIKIVIKRC